MYRDYDKRAEELNALDRRSSVTVLNALDIQAPVDPTYAPYPYWTQTALTSDPCVTAIHDPNRGSTRAQLSAMLSTCYPAISIQNITAPTTTRELRAILVEALSEDATSHVVANFYRPGLEEVGGGHFSPVAAYDTVGDYALILDVARYKYPPVWVPLADLRDAMAATDPAAGAPRGLLVVDVAAKEDSVAVM